MAHKGTKEFLFGALVGGIIGVAAVSASRAKGKKKNSSLHGIRNTLGHVGKAMQKENQFSELLDWTLEGIQLWNHLKKGK